MCPVHWRHPFVVTWVPPGGGFTRAIYNNMGDGEAHRRTDIEQRLKRRCELQTVAYSLSTIRGAMAEQTDSTAMVENLSS